MKGQITGTPGVNQLVRTYYFPGELLGDKDFVRDQQYVRDLVAVQNQVLYAPGVVTGLQPTISGSVVTLSAGLAFNPYGVPLVVAGTVTRDLAGDRLGPGSYNLLLLYSDSLSNNTPAPSLQASHMVVEAPVLATPLPTAAPPPPMAVIVGQVEVATGGQFSLSTTGRQLSHALLPPAPTPTGQGVAAAAPPTSGQPIASLAIGAASTALPPAPLTVTRDFGGGDASGPVACFAFSGGGSDGGLVALGLPVGNGGYDLLHATYNGQRVWAVDQTGKTFSVSDAVTKRDVRTIADPLAIVEGLRGVTYRSRIDGAAQVGLIAQEVAAALPQAVRIDPDGLHALDYDAVVGVLVEAVKQLAARIDAHPGSPATAR